MLKKVGIGLLSLMFLLSIASCTKEKEFDNSNYPIDEAVTKKYLADDISENGEDITRYHYDRNDYHLTFADNNKNKLVIKGDRNDGIENIIPIAYFYNVGSYLRMGPGYGFYISTSENCDSYYSQVLVFDYDYNLNLKEQVVEQNIKMLYQHEYAGLLKSSSKIECNNIVVEFESDQDRLVKLPSQVIREIDGKPSISYDEIDEIHLTQISMALGIENMEALNEYESGYEATDDMGSYFTDGVLETSDGYYGGSNFINDYSYVQAGVFVSKNVISDMIVSSNDNKSFEMHSSLDSSYSTVDYKLDGVSFKALNETRDEQLKMQKDEAGKSHFTKYIGYTCDETTPYLGEANFKAKFVSPKDSSYNPGVENVQPTRFNASVSLVVTDRHDNFLDSGSFKIDDLFSAKPIILDIEERAHYDSKTPETFIFESYTFTNYVINFKAKEGNFKVSVDGLDITDKLVKIDSNENEYSYIIEFYLGNHVINITSDSKTEKVDFVFLPYKEYNWGDEMELSRSRRYNLYRINLDTFNNLEPGIYEIKTNKEYTDIGYIRYVCETTNDEKKIDYYKNYDFPKSVAYFVLTDEIKNTRGNNYLYISIVKRDNEVKSFNLTCEKLGDANLDDDFIMNNTSGNELWFQFTSEIDISIDITAFITYSFEDVPFECDLYVYETDMIQYGYYPPKCYEDGSAAYNVNVKAGKTYYFNFYAGKDKMIMWWIYDMKFEFSRL